MTEEAWRIRQDREGLYAVHDENGYPIGIDCTRERALLIAAAPELLAVLEAQEHADKLRDEYGMYGIGSINWKLLFDKWTSSQKHARGLREAVLARFRQDSETRPLSGLSGESESGTKKA